MLATDSSAANGAPGASLDKHEGIGHELPSSVGGALAVAAPGAIGPRSGRGEKVGGASSLDAGRGAAAPLEQKASEPLKQAKSRPSTCERWPKMMRLHSSSGAMVPGRCRSTRQCDYCSRLSAVEWAEVFALDGMLGEAPTVYVVTTTRETKPSLDAVKEAKRRLISKLRDRWPRLEYACIVEFTTGRGERSGGRRRPHWNWLFKGVPLDELAAVEAVVAEVWTAYLDAEPAAQWVGPVSEVGGLMKYLSLHFHKESQRPPKWWKGHRVTRSRGYLWTESWKAHREASESLRFKRELHKAEQAGYEGSEAFVVAEAEAVRKAALRWECVELTVDTSTGELVRARPIHGGETVSLDRPRPFNPPGHGTIAEWAAVDEYLHARGRVGASEALRNDPVASDLTQMGLFGSRR